MTLWLHTQSIVITCAKRCGYLRKALWLLAQSIVVTCAKHCGYLRKALWLPAQSIVVTCAKHCGYLRLWSYKLSIFVQNELRLISSLRPFIQFMCVSDRSPPLSII
jgi:predicted Rdx family selenoprotein